MPRFFGESKAVRALNRTVRPIHVYSDSQYVQIAFVSLLRNQPLPARKAFNRIRTLYSAAERHAAARTIRFSRVSQNNADHRHCHHLALNMLRQHIRGNSDLALDYALRDEAKRYTSLIRERTKLETRLRAIEEELLLSDTRSRALLFGRYGSSWAARYEEIVCEGWM